MTRQAAIREPVSNKIDHRLPPCYSAASTTAPQHDDDKPASDTIPHITALPEPGSSYIIRTIDSGGVITLRRGEVIITPQEKGDASIWMCVKEEGWFGFRNEVSYQLLGYDHQWRLRCSAKEHRAWEKFHFERGREGGLIMYMPHWSSRRPVKVQEHGCVDQLMAMDPDDVGTAWEFIKV